MIKSEAVKATKKGAIAACISAAITFLFFIAASNIDLGAPYEEYGNPFIFIDIVLILICAFAMSRQSRFFSIFIFIYFAVSKLFLFIDNQSVNGINIGMTFLFLYYYGKAIQGSFVFQKLNKEENMEIDEDKPETKGVNPLIYLIGIPALLIVIIIFIFGIFTYTGISPKTWVQAGIELDKDDAALLRSEGIIKAKEKIEYFYSDGLFFNT